MKERIVLHTADLHIGRNRKFGDYLEQQTLMLKGILRIVEQTLKTHTESEVWLVVAGDVFDRNEDTEREEFVSFMTHLLFPLVGLKRKFERFDYFIIDGNHDRQPYLDNPSVLSPLAPITPNLAVKEPLHFPDQRLLLVPFGGYSETDFKKLFQTYKPEFVVAHECLSRMVTDLGWTPPRDQDHYIEIDNVMTSDIAGVFLGDIHKSQSLDKEQKSWYSGSPITLDFGHRQPKGVLCHYYRLKADGRWSQDRLPELIPLQDSRIKQHYTLGRVLDPQAVPIGSIAGHFRKNYLKLTISPEVHQVIDTAFPEFFNSPMVSWEFDRGQEIAAASSAGFSGQEETTISVEDYYKPLLAAWVSDNGKHMTIEEQVECLERLISDFNARS